MNIRDFQYLIAVDELKNFSKASKFCNISQPALSQQIKKVEEQLGFDIFERERKNIITSAKGKKVIKYAKSICNSYAKIKEINNSELTVKIALIPTICPYLLPLIVNQLNKKLPKVRFYFLEAKTDDLLQKLQDGEIDFGILAYFPNLFDDGFVYEKLYDEEFLLSLPKDSPLTVDNFPDLVKEKKLILLEEGNCMSDNIRDICSLYKQNSFSDFFATNIETVKNMVKMNNGIALLPALSLLNEKDLKLISFKKTREVGIISRKNSTQQELLLQIKEIILSSYSF